MMEYEAIFGINLLISDFLCHPVTADQETTPLNKPQKPVKKDIKQKPSIVASSESEPAEEDLSPAKVIKWAIDDLKETIAWLESQEERVS
ncbi:hypothetical protein Scep_019144 [Stephania cephalantha]|uniref:Uncharacterized protein n=1 Tax=Stephania cephalantha TaxID=152367 RepID=A0AAP0NMZ3_9MAGN